MDKPNLIKIVVIGCEPPEVAALSEFFTDSPAYSLVGIASTGHEGFEQCKEVQPDIALIDRSVSGNSSLEVIKLLKEISPLTNIIMISWTNEMDWMREALLAGAEDFLMKPLNQALVENAIDMALKRRST